MGVFDNVRINPDLLPVSAEEKLLLKEACSGDFQTKSLQCLLRIIEITDAGKLRWKDTDWGADPENPPSYPDEEEGSADSVTQDGHPVFRWVREPDFTGEIRFYESVNDVWYEFCALFAEGELLKIVKTLPK